MLVLWVFGWEGTRIKMCSPPAPGKGNHTSETAMMDTCAFLVSLSSDPTSSSTRIVLGSLMKMWRITHLASITTQFSAAWWPCLPLPSTAPQRISGVLIQGTRFSRVSWSVLCYYLPPNMQSRASNSSIFHRPQLFFSWAIKPLSDLQKVLRSSGSSSDNLGVSPRPEHFIVRI